MINLYERFRDKSHRKIMEAADRGIQTWLKGGIDVGTYFTKRGKRTYRGKAVNSAESSPTHKLVKRKMGSF